jgi:uncharacterized cupin superfamily protein
VVRQAIYNRGMTKPRRHPNVVNVDELEPNEVKKGKHHAIGRRFGPAAGNQQLGCMQMELPPGAISFPFHYHCMNEESIYVLSGTGIARIGDARVQVRAGDWIAFPVGPETPHQMINDGSEPLRYLTIATAHKCEVVGYPDSKKIGAMAGASFDKPWIRQVVRQGESLDYWDGEPNA